MLGNKPLDEITVRDVAALVTHRISEGSSIEFKRELHAASDKGKKEFLADVSSFANAKGGDIVFGVADEEGVAIAADGLVSFDPDRDILRLESTLRDGLDPRIDGIELQTVPGGKEGPFLVVRVPSSKQKPHRVKIRGTSRFYGRGEKGKYELDTAQIIALATAYKEPNDDSYFDEQLAAILMHANVDDKSPPPSHVWEFCLRPKTFKRRWRRKSDLRELCFTLAGNSGPTMTLKHSSSKVFDWGIYYSMPTVAWAITYEGQFWFRWPISEKMSRRRLHDAQWSGTLDLIVIYEHTICGIGQIFEAMAKLSGRSDYAGAQWTCTAKPLAGYRLTNFDSHVFSEKCHAAQYSRPTPGQGRELTAANWWQVCVECLSGFCDLFDCEYLGGQDPIVKQLKLCGLTPPTTSQPSLDR